VSKIYSVNALCGSGKTYAAIRYAVKCARFGEKFVIVQPSKKLIQQSYRDCLSVADEQGLNISVTQIDSDTCGLNSVKGEIIRYLRKEETRGQILFITHAAFLSMPYWHNAREWDVLFDELPVVDKDFTRNVPATHHIVTNHISTISNDPVYYQLIADDPRALRPIAENREKDEVFEVFKDVSNALLSEHWEVYARKENWNRMMNADSEGGNYQFLCFGLLKPTIFEAFKSATVMGAMLTESVMYHWWLNRDVTFEAHSFIDEKARERLPSHENGEHMTIRYFFDQPWSKHLRDTPVYVNAKATDRLVYMRAKMHEEFSDTAFLWVANNDVPDAEMAGFPKAIRLSNSPHGLNQYRDIHNVVFLSALNRRPAHFKFMETRGIKANDLRDAMVHQITYQAVMRSSLRDTGNAEPKTVLVSDRQTAEWLGTNFPGCAIGQISNPVKATKKRNGRPPIGDRAMSPAERQKRHRDQKLQELRCHESTIYYSSFVTSPQATIFGSIYASTGEAITDVTDIDSFINELEGCHADEFDDKHNNALISPAAFDPDKSANTSRGIENITHIWGIWLDNDGGDLSWREFQKKFPDLRMVCMNTWSEKSRYRVFIPTTEPMSVECHRRVIAYMMGQLNGYYDDKTTEYHAKKGRRVKRHGFDTSKFVPSSLFYLPCQAKDPKDSFFVDFEGDALDPWEWGAASIAMSHDPEITRPQLELANDNAQERRRGSVALNSLRDKLASEDHTPDRASRIAYAMAFYASIPSGMGLRHTGFFGLGLALKRLGLNDNEIFGHLTDADSDGSRRKKKAIDGVVKSLKSGKWAS
jgi:hypothetical protein